MVTRGVLKALLCLALCAAPAAAASVSHLSFGDKYDKVDSTGTRIISDAFTFGGSTEVKKNFIRLTPDRQSKRGHIWSKQRVNNNQMLAVLTYRIHGQGKKWFGDGIGLWITTEPQHTPGDNHGFTDKFYGVGIVFDTFRNVEHRGGHKDVTVQVNDATKTLDMLHEETKLGCDAAYRFHANSDSFDPVFSSSRIRVKIIGQQLTLEMDARSEGKWTQCYEGTLPFSKDWLRRATIGITATTGSLADNHDVIKLQTFDDVNDYAVAHADSEVWTHNYSKLFDKLLDSSVCDQMCKITILQKFISNFQVESELWFEELKELTQNTVQKLREKENENSAKIQALTDRMNSMVESRVGEKLANVKNDVQQKISAQVEGELVGASGGWRLPFFFLVVALAGLFGFAYQKYRKLVKSHLM